MGLTKKNCYRQIWCVLLWISLCSASAFRNIIAVNTLPDGEVETRITYKKISAKETTVGKGNASGLKYRQIIRGNNFLQLIYDNNNTLNDCEFIQDENLSRTFLTNFKKDLSHLSATSNVSIQILEQNSLPQDVKSWLDMKKLRRECKKLHSRLRTEADRMKHLRNSNSTRRFENSRNKRSYFIFPGTRWCGVSNSAKRYTELGLLSNTDRCCRHHDRCKKDIPGMTKKYNLFNPNIYTLSHCFCDQSFRACLKLVGTSDANVVGKLFFNVVQSQCFVLKYKKRCIKRSWWGKCEKHKFVKYAILRENLSY